MHNSCSIKKEGGNIEGASRKYSENTSVKHHSPTQLPLLPHTHTHTQRKRFINNDESYEYGKSSPLGSLSSLLITALQVCVSSIFKIPLDVLS